MNILVIISLAFILSLGKYDVVCKDFRNFLSSKTPYRYVENDDTNIGPFKECKLVKTWMMIRHGSRYPGEKLIKFMQITLPQLKNDILNHYEDAGGPLNEKQLSVFRTWSPLNISLSEEKYLSLEGEKEMENLAIRMQKRFGSVISTIYDKNMFIFKHTPTERTFKSAKHFAIGLFGEDIAQNINFTVTAPNDPVLRFYKGCKYWVNNVKKNPLTYKQYKLYSNGEEMIQAIKNISSILGFSYHLNYNTAKYLYQTCAFEQSLWGENFVSPWCFLFDANSFQVLEYAADLKNYWLHGYGSSITRKLPCNVMRNIKEFFESKDSFKSAFYFTHSGTIVKTLAYFGLYHTDGALKYDNRNTNRAWRSSYMDAFGSNIEFILYNCNGIDKVLAMHQERPVLLPECEDYLCPIDTIIKSRKKSINKCDLSKLCAVPHDEL